MSAKMGIQKLLSLSLVGMAVAISSQVSAGTIIGSAHDFSLQATGSWNQEICIACHTPHNAQNVVGAVGPRAPLWNHQASATKFTMYTGAFGTGTTKRTSTIDGVIDIDPTGTSLLCLSCHDGTVALDSFGGGAGTGILMGQINASANLGTSGENDHPISITYDSVKDTSLWNEDRTPSNMYDKAGIATTAVITVGGKGSITGDLLENGKVQCGSCHDVHNTFTKNVGTAAGAKNYLLKVDMVKSKLCLTCHNK